MGFISPLSLLNWLNWSWQNNRDTLIPQRKSMTGPTRMAFKKWFDPIWNSFTHSPGIQGTVLLFLGSGVRADPGALSMNVCVGVCYGWSTSLFLFPWIHTALERGLTVTAPVMNPYKFNEAGLKITALSLHINKHQLEMEWASLCLQGEDWAVSLMYTRRTPSGRNHDLWSVSCGGVNLTSLLNVFLSNIA